MGASSIQVRPSGAKATLPIPFTAAGATPSRTTLPETLAVWFMRNWTAALLPRQADMRRIFFRDLPFYVDTFGGRRKRAIFDRICRKFVEGNAQILDGGRTENAPPYFLN
ncbi:hypothetical protein [Mesorhizobium sp. YR577]|uniref:hypothetical protein n=1 Tax=Mesorhizobium sp. YR577 TaxID=1884373 RepID=UPI0011148135|nr:hypothetical protein [Mesorhizobium sp. YR577]